MKPTARKDHRRAHLRFEVMGAMPGAIISTQTLKIVNLGSSGVLVEAASPLSENAEYQMQLVLEGSVSEATVKVRRVTELRSEEGTAPRYRMGLEFLAISPEAADEINRIVVTTLGAET